MPDEVTFLAGRRGRRPLRERGGRFCLGLFVFLTGRCLSSRCLLYEVILLAGRRGCRERVGGFCLGLFVFLREGAFHPDVCSMMLFCLRDVEGAVPYERGVGDFVWTVCFWAWRCLPSRCLPYEVTFLAGRRGRRPLRERVGRFCLGLFLGGIGGSRPLRVRKEKELTGIDRFGQNRFL